jgi:hypothetical protein
MQKIKKSCISIPKTTKTMGIFWMFCSDVTQKKRKNYRHKEKNKWGSRIAHSIQISKDSRIYIPLFQTTLDEYFFIGFLSSKIHMLLLCSTGGLKVWCSFSLVYHAHAKMITCTMHLSHKNIKSCLIDLYGESNKILLCLPGQNLEKKLIFCPEEPHIIILSANPWIFICWVASTLWGQFQELVGPVLDHVMNESGFARI